MNISKIVLPLIIAAGMSACGGSGGGGGSNPVSGTAADAGSSPASATAAGLWQGTTDTSRTIAGLVLDDGAYWFIYSPPGNSAGIAGVVQGNSSSSNGSSLSSLNGKDFNFESLGVNNVTLAGTYAAKSSLSGSLTYSPGDTATFTGSYNTDYDLAPNLATIEGTYEGNAATSSGTEPTTVTVTGAGAISGRGANGCDITGSATPRSKGNVYDVSVTFGGGVYPNGTSTVTGVARFDARTNQLVSATLDSARTAGFIYVGTKVVATTTTTTTTTTATTTATTPACAQVSGNWTVTDSATVTCSGSFASVGGTQTATGIVSIAQNGCNISFVSSVGTLRAGTVAGNTVQFTGPLATAGPGVTFTQNRIDLSGTVAADGQSINLTGNGTLAGSIQGSAGSCSASSTDGFTRAG